MLTGYHAMHPAAQVDSSMHSVCTLQSHHRRHLWSVFTEAYSAEARDLSIFIRRYLLQHFISFLIDDTSSTDISHWCADNRYLVSRNNRYLVCRHSRCLLWMDSLQTIASIATSTSHNKHRNHQHVLVWPSLVGSQ